MLARLNHWLTSKDRTARKRRPLSAAEIRKRKAEIESQYGVWFASYIELGNGIATDAVMTDENSKANLWSRFHSFSQIILALTAQPLSQLRVLDLAVHEGATSIELAQQGAEVIGVEGREMNIVKARFAAEALGLPNVTFLHDDVRNISPNKLGEFDVVLCAGILYHLNFQEICSLIEKIGVLCKRCVIVDTHCSLTPREYGEYRGQTYYGHSTIDHSPDQTTAESRTNNTYSSLDNDFVFLLTQSSLANLLVSSGFGTVFESTYPYWDKTADRVVLAGAKVPWTTPKTFHSPKLALPQVPENPGSQRTILIPGHEYADGNPETFKLPDRVSAMVTPNAGTGDGGSFSFILPREPYISSGLTFAQVLFGNPQREEAPFCLIHYDGSTELLKLYKGPGVLDFTEAVAPGAPSQPLTTDTCSVYPASSSVAVDDSSIAMKIALKFQPAMEGNRVVYWRTFDGGSDTGWRRIGTWNVSGSRH